jgi:hypothetical protein
MRLMVLIAIIIIVIVMLNGCSVDMIWFGEGLRHAAGAL